MLKVGIWSLVIAVFLGYFGYKEGEIAFRSTVEPQEISLEKLITRGPVGNAHVVVTDFALCDNFVYQATEKKKEHWTDVWIPIVPNSEVEGADSLTPKNVKALFFSTNIPNQQELEGRLNQRPVHGLVTNTIVSLNGKVRNLLKENYPETDFDKCLIIQEGRRPSSREAVYFMGAGTGTAALLGMGLILGGWLRSKPKPVT